MFKIHRSFSRNLTFIFMAVLTLSMALSGYLITRRVKEQLINELAVSLETEGRLISSKVDARLFSQGPSVALEKLAVESSKISGVRVTFISPKGAVIGDSDVPFEQLATVENHAGRPEVQDAFRGLSGQAVRHSHTVGRDLLYQSVPVKGPSGIVGVIRLAENLDSVEEKLAAARGNVIHMSVSAGLAGLAILLWISFLVRRRLEELTDTAQQLSEGRYQARVLSHSQDEFGTLGQAFNFLAEKIQTTVEALSRDKTQLAAILSNMVEGVVAVDRSGRILAINPSLQRLFSLQETDAIGQPFLDVLRHSQLDDLIRQVLRHGEIRTEEVRTFEPVERLFEAHAVPLRVEGAQEGALLVLHDITRIRQLEQIRREFVANVSHELRTPLASIKGFAETLKMGAVDDKANRMEFLSSIERQAEQMTLLIDDLLDLAAIESGKRAPQPSRVDLAELTREVINSLRPLAERRGVKLILPESPAPAPVNADLAQMKQVLINLIDNAVKFNREGGSVKISFDIQDDRLTVHVIDTGMGIPSQALPRVFERFFRVDKARSKELGGTGLGLAIVKHIIEAHHGTVGVESREGQGSTFHFSLPR